MVESKVECYYQSFPFEIQKASNEKITDTKSKEYVDFFSGAGALLYGHNPSYIKKEIIDYIQNDGVSQSLDMHSKARSEFIATFEKLILKPRGMSEYLMQFTSPSGTDAIESAVKLAKLNTQRETVVAFYGSYHGQTKQSRAMTDMKEQRVYDANSDVEFLEFDSLSELTKLYEIQPACVVLEVIQASSEVKRASKEWLQKLESICKEIGSLLIVDDIQAGSGRSGSFFSFEFANIKPDIITLSKAIGGGYPLSIVLFKSKLDKWESGEHTGTFRGNNIAFVASKVMLEKEWNKKYNNRLSNIEQYFKQELSKLECIQSFDMYGCIGAVRFLKNTTPLQQYLFRHGFMVEVVGKKNNILKLLPTIHTKKEQIRKFIELIREFYR